MVSMKKPVTKSRRKPAKLTKPKGRVTKAKRKRVPEVHIVEFVEDRTYQPTGKEIDGEEFFKELGF